MSSVSTCLLKHLGSKSPIAVYRAEMAEDARELVSAGMAEADAWARVVGAKLTELKAERARIEADVSDAYSKTAAGKPAEQKSAEKPRVFKSRKAAEAERDALGNEHKLRAVKGGWILRRKSDAEMAAEARNGKRLRAGASGKRSLLTVIAAGGGLNLKDRADTIGEGNRNVGGKMLFTREGKSIHQWAEELHEGGWMPVDESEAVGWLQKAIGDEYAGRAEHYQLSDTERLEQQVEAARGEEPDPLAPFDMDELDDAGYAAATPDVQALTEAILTEAEALGIDSEAIKEDAARATEGLSDDEYHAQAQRIAREAIAAARQAAAPSDTGAAGRGGEDRGQVAGDQGEAEVDPLSLGKDELNRRVDAVVAAGGAPDSIRALQVLRKRFVDATGQPSIPPQGSRLLPMYPPDDDPLLAPQTPEDLRAKAKREADAEAADKAEQKRLEAKARADAQRDDFALTGSDRAADVGAAQGQGQGDIFAAAAPAPLYASRPVTNAEDIRAWAAGQGFKSTLPAEDMHVTVAYSKSPISGSAVPSDSLSIAVNGGKRSVEPLGDDGAVVLKFASDEMQARWKQYRDAGASWDYESYTPHVTLTYDGKGVDLSKVAPYAGPINLGPEKQEALNENKKDEYVEEPVSPAAEAPFPAEPSPIDQRIADAEKAGGRANAGRNKIEDFGEKLEGARKDYATLLKDAQDVDVAAEPLSKSWPEPDYEKLLAAGGDPYMVAFIHAARDEIPTKPQRSWKLRGWVDGVKSLREMSRKFMSGEVDKQTMQTVLAKPEFSNVAKSVGSRAELYELIGHGRSLKGISFAENHYTMYRGQENVRKWAVEQKAKATAFSNWPRELAVADTKAEMLEQFKAKIGSLDTGTKAKRQPQFVIYRQRGKDGYTIGKKIGREYIDLHQAPDVAAARTYMAEHLADLEAKLEKYQTLPLERNPENQPRVGDDHRNGAPVTKEVFEQTFGFRGVQFGNYVEQSRRQSDLNEGYDALMDMAAVLGIPPRSLSLNGKLGLAFGARGKGGKNAPGAHYEPDRVVINLTKGGGPGALAHEWWHSLDNYFGSTGRVPAYGTGAGPAADTREQMKAAFTAVKAATQMESLRQRSQRVDQRKPSTAKKPYWDTPIELSARSFESYIVAKLKDQNAANDYLANIVSKEFWDADESIRADFFGNGKAEETYPYPTADEAPEIRAAFDNFFKVVETRSDDAGNVALYEPDAPAYTGGAYETDLFGTPLPEATRANRRAGPGRAGLRGNVQPEPAVPADTPAPPGDYYAPTVVGVVHQRKLGAAKITTPQEAAQATRYLYESAVERLDGIVTDKDGRPLAVVGGFKGALSQASVYPATIMGEAVRVPGAAHIWFSHNHPSGTAVLSRADEFLNQTLSEVFRGSGIEPMGLLAIGGDEYGFIGAGKLDALGPTAIRASASSATVPAIERLTTRPAQKKEMIQSPDQAKAAAGAYYSASGGPGLMLLDAQHGISAWVPIDASMSGNLRGTGGLNAIYRAVSESNAGAAIIVHGDELDGRLGHGGHVTAAQNIAAALAKLEVRVLDAINAKTGKSAAEQGGVIADGPVYSRANAAGRSDPAALRSALEAELGADTVAALEQAGLLTIADRPDANMPSDVAGVTQNGRIGLFAANTAPGSVAVAYHEALHATLRAIIGDAAFDALMARMPALVAGNRKFFSDARIPADTPAAALNGERASYSVEAYQRNREAMPNGVRKWVESLIALLRVGLANALRVANVGLKLRVSLLADASALHRLAREGLRSVALAQRGKSDSIASKSAAERGVIDAQFAGGVSYAKAASDQGLRGLDAPTQRMVLARVVSQLHDQKILRRVVEFVPVEMVHDLTGKKGSAESLLRDDAVLVKLAAINTDASVSRLVDAAGAIMRATARAVAEREGVTLDGSNEPRQLGPALAASNRAALARPQVQAGASVGTKGAVNRASDAGGDLAERGSALNTIVDRHVVTPTSDGVLGTGGGDTPSVPPILYSRAGIQTAQDLIDSKGGVFDFNRLGKTKQDRLRTVMDGSRPFWLGALTRDQIADVYGAEIPPVKDYDTLTRAMENERSKMASDADNLYNEWAKINPEVNDRLASIMLDATVNQVHPDGPFAEGVGVGSWRETQLKLADRAKWETYKRLAAEFKALPKDAQAMYGKVKAFHEATLTKLRDALEARIERQVEDGKARAAALDSIRAMFDKYLGSGPYFPLSRFGDFLVIADRADGERVVAAYETAGEQQAAARALQGDGFTVKMKTSKTYSREQDGAAGKFIGDVLVAVDKLDMDDANVAGNMADLKGKLLDDINQMFIRSLPDLSYRKHFMHRKGTPGFSSDVMRGFASSAFHAASHIARLNHGDKMTFALQDAYSAIENAPEGDFNQHSQVLNELTKRHDAMLNPNAHPIAAMLNQVGFVMYLGLSPAAGIVNMLQTVMVTMPHLGARYGFGKANASLGAAYKDILAAPMNRQNGWNAAQSMKLTPAERAMMSELQDDGVIDLTQAHDLSAATSIDTGNVARSKTAFAMARAMKIVGWTFHIPEVMNRQVTALSAYRLEMQKSGNVDKAKDAAREAIKRTHFDYSASNRARFMQGNVARVIFQFKQYSQNMTYLLGRAMHQALKGETQEVRDIARKQLVATLGVTFGMAGALGLPGLGGVMGLIGAMVGALDDDDKPWDWKVEMRNALADTVGKDLGEVIAHGIPRALMPWDISSRVGMADLWWRQNDREGQNPREAFASDAQNILGPTAGTMLGLYTAADHMARGNWSKAAESVVPKFLRDPLKAVREASDGMTNYNGEPLRDVTAIEAAGRALGFAPAKGSEMFEARNAVKNAETVLNEKRQRLLSSVAKARMDKDGEAVTELQADINEFNRRNPTFRITGESVLKSILAKRRARAETDEGIRVPRTKNELRDLGRFAEV